MHARDRDRLLDKARRALIRAAAALGEPDWHDSLAFALFETGCAMLWIAKLDERGQALDRVIARLTKERDERTPSEGAEKCEF